MISVLSACQTARALSMTVSGISFPLLVLAVNVTCHMPTIEGPSSSSDRFAMTWAVPICGCQSDGFASFPGSPHCARALGIIAHAKTKRAQSRYQPPITLFSCSSSPWPESPAAHETSPRFAPAQWKEGEAGGEVLVNQQTLLNLAFSCDTESYFPRAGGFPERPRLSFR